MQKSGDRSQKPEESTDEYRQARAEVRIQNSECRGIDRRTPNTDNREPATGNRQPTDRQRTAARLSIVKARQVWHEMLCRPDFVLPLAVLELIRQGLLKAVFWHLTDCSARYATRFREGLFAISVVRSLAAAGEKVEDYLEHVGQMVKAFTNGRFSINDCPPVSSELSSSEFGVPGSEPVVPELSPQWASQEPVVENEQRANAEPQTPNPEPANVEPGQPATANRQPATVLLTLSTALAQITWRRLRASRRHAEWERRAVVPLFRKLAAERKRGEPMTHARLVELAEDLHRVLFYSAGRFRHQLERLNHRFEAITARIIREAGAPSLPLHVRPSEAVENAVDTAASIAMDTAAGTAADSAWANALPNPFRSAPEVRTRSKPRQARVKSTSQWQHRHEVRTPESRQEALEERALEDHGIDLGILKPGAYRASALAVDDEIEAAQRETLPPECEDPERFRELVARALSWESPSGTDHVPVESERLREGVRQPGSSPAAGEAKTAPAPDPVPEGLADALWKRLELSRRQAEEEREQVEALLDDYCASLGRRGRIVDRSSSIVVPEVQDSSTEDATSRDPRSMINDQEITNTGNRTPATENRTPATGHRNPAAASPLSPPRSSCCCARTTSTPRSKRRGWISRRRFGFT